jgi:hypothetical protein
MTAVQSTGPSLSYIGEIQDEEDNLRCQLAAKHFYRIAKWVYFGGVSFALALALASPLILLFRSDLGPTLGAVAGGWIFVSRLVLEPLKREQQLKGAAAQECFDCAVLGLDWNESLARRLSDEEISSACRSRKDIGKARSWYPTDGNELAWPKSVLICQRSNAVWARRQHRTYARTVVCAAVAWAIVGVVVAVADSASLGAYLVTIALPSLPAFLDASELSKGHSAAAQSRQLLEDQIDSLLQSESASRQDMREIQDQLFSLRREAPLVPEWFYRVIRPNYEEDMRYAAKHAVKRSGTSGDS